MDTPPRGPLHVTVLMAPNFGVPEASAFPPFPPGSRPGQENMGRAVARQQILARTCGSTENHISYTAARRWNNTCPGHPSSSKVSARSKPCDS